MSSTSSTLELQISAALQSNPYIAGRRLRFETHEGRVTLHGKVASFYQKQMAQEVLRHVNGVSAIENQLEVSWA